MLEYKLRELVSCGIRLLHMHYAVSRSSWWIYSCMFNIGEHGLVISGAGSQPLSTTIFKRLLDSGNYILNLLKFQELNVCSEIPLFLKLMNLHGFSNHWKWLPIRTFNVLFYFSQLYPIKYSRFWPKNIHSL